VLFYKSVATRKVLLEQPSNRIAWECLLGSVIAALSWHRGHTLDA
jgi:hypothetical protein